VIAIVAPEPAAWVLPIAEAAAAHEPVWLFAPFALPAAPALLPARWRAGWQRRYLELDAEIREVLAWPALEAGVRLWTAGQADRLIRARMRTRALVDALASRALPREARMVIAPAFSARRTFATALRRDVTRVLVSDFPHLRRLHADLDLAARAHPTSRFLRRHRASASEIAHQEAEQVLANTILMRGRFAHEQLVSAGHSPNRLVPLQDASSIFGGPPRAAPPRVPSPLGPVRRVLLAGLATARNGSNEALATLEQAPELTLLIRPGEGLEPKALLAHPRVRIATAAERALENVDAVLAPAWCESYPEELGRAVARGLPVIATARAAGWLPVDSFHEVQPGDVVALVRALARAS
jgi:hypothetical protein